MSSSPQTWPLHREIKPAGYARTSTVSESERTLTPGSPETKDEKRKPCRCYLGEDASSESSSSAANSSAEAASR
jgi:hypothetical protein